MNTPNTEMDYAPEDEAALNNKRIIMNVPGDHVADACADVFDEKDGRLILWGYRYAHGRKWTWKDCAKNFGVETGALNRTWRGQPNDGELEKVLKATRQLIEEVDNAPAEYALTEAAVRIEGLFGVALRFAQKGVGGLFLVAGPTGCGKTTVLEALTHRYNHGATDYYPFDNGGGKKHVVKDLAERNNINRWLNYNDMEPRVRDCYGPRGVMVLVFGEIDLTLERRQMPTDILEWLRRLADIRKCSIILEGRFDRFLSNVRRTEYDVTQLIRRCKRKLIIDVDGTEADIEKLFKFRCPKVKYTPEIKTALLGINGQDYGGFGGVNNVIDIAIDYAQEDCDGAALTEAHILTVAKKEKAANDKFGKEMKRE
jgi:DNA transposition AAA+ family ATPase